MVKKYPAIDCETNVMGKDCMNRICMGLGRDEKPCLICSEDHLDTSEGWPEGTLPVSLNT